jgi:hypothetical protein
MKTQTAGAYMVPLGEYLTVNENETINNALRMIKDSLHKKDNGGAWLGPRLVIVLKDGMKPTGMLTLKSILKAAGLRMLTGDVFFKAESFSWYYLNSMFAGSGVPVREVMRSLGMPSVEYSTTIYQAARIFVRYGVNHLPVTDGQKIIGILNSRDLFYGYYELTRFMLDREAILNRASDPTKVANGYAAL